MLIQVKEAKIEDGEISAIALFAATTEELTNYAEADKYSSKTKIADKITEKIATEIAAEFLAKHKADIMSQIDIDKIIKGIQIKVVEGFSLQRQ